MASISPETHSGYESLNDLKRLVSRNTLRSRMVIALRAIVLAITAGMTLFLTALVTDYLFHFNVLGRVVAFVSILIGFVLIGWWVIFQWRRMRFTEEQIALAVEQRSQGIDNRLINTLQLAKDQRFSGSQWTSAVIRENHQRIQSLKLGQAVNAKTLWMGLGAMLFVVLIGLILFLAKGEELQSSLQRIFLPLTELSPIYRTSLKVAPGNIEVAKGSDVKVTVFVEGVHPESITIIYTVQGSRQTETIPLSEETTQVSHLFKQIQEDITYFVRGGDFRSEVYTIHVPVATALQVLRMEVLPPAYTHLPATKMELANGNLEALLGSHVKLNFVFNQPVEEAVMVVQKNVDSVPKEERIPLNAIEPTEMSGELLIQDVGGYRLELTQNGKVIENGPYTVRILADQWPQAYLEGMQREQEADMDEMFSLKLRAEDDYGLSKVALGMRKVDPTNKDWKVLSEWDPKGATQWKQDEGLELSDLDVEEGDRLEIALLVRDTDPAKESAPWTESNLSQISVGGKKTSLAFIYRQILKSEVELRKLAASQQSVLDSITPWSVKLDPSKGLRWDDKAVLDQFRNGIASITERQNALRIQTGAVARDMVEVAGNIRLGLGLLADAEMIRSAQILESAVSQDTPQQKRAALKEAQMTQERTIESLKKLSEQFATFRQAWENEYMTEFVGMLGKEQESLHQETSKMLADAGVKVAQEKWQRIRTKQQNRLKESTSLGQKALSDVGLRVGAIDKEFGKAFTEASRRLGAEVAPQMQQAGNFLQEGDLKKASVSQEEAHTELVAIFASLKQAAEEAAKRSLQLGENKKDLAGQQEIEALRAAIEDNKVEQGNVSVETILKIQNAQQQPAPPTMEVDKEVSSFILDEKTKAALAQQVNAGGDRSKPDVKLADFAQGPSQRSPEHDNQTPNEIKAPPIPELHDLVGDLMEAADEVSKDFDVLNVNSAATSLDSGTVAKMGGNINSFAAAAKTGNQKPPASASSGGASGTGRQGGRSHGETVGDTAVNRRGRDEPLEGMETAPMQAGSIKEVLSDDPQKGASTGMGGKKVESKEKNWSMKDAGAWNDEFAKHLDAPQKVDKQVERQGAPLDAKAAALLEDVNSTQEQVIERAKAIRKELKGLFLPTERLDDLISKIAENLERLKKAPDSDLFRTQQENIDQLRNEMQVLNRAYAGFHASLPRERQIKGRVLDEPAWQPLPEYEQAVKEYYEMLSVQ